MKTKRLLLLACLIAVGLPLTKPAQGSTITFAAGQRLICPAEPTTCGGGIPHVEPAIEVDPRTGDAYVSAQVALPAGTDIFARKADGTWEFRKKIDEIPAVTARNGTALGGGDSSLAIDSSGSVFVSSLWAGANTVAASEDGFQTGRFPVPQYMAGRPIVDRQWIAADGDETLYMSYRDFQSGAIWVSKSIDGGLTWPINTPVEGAQNAIRGAQTIGGLEVDQNSHAVYQVLSKGRTDPITARPVDDIVLARSDDGGLTWDLNVAYTNRTDDAEIADMGLLPFPSLAIDEAGNLYIAFGDKVGTYLMYSTDAGETWSAPIKVNSTATTIFPWIVAGEPGKVGITWIGTSEPSPGAYADDGQHTQHLWYLYYAQTTNLFDPVPLFEEVQASDDPVHRGFICLNGLACDLDVTMTTTDPTGGRFIEGRPLDPDPDDIAAGGRQLAEVVQMALDVDGYAVIAYPDDCEKNSPTGGSYAAPNCTATQRTGHTVIAKQTGGAPLT